MIVEFICNFLFDLAYFFVNLLPRFPSFQQIDASLQPILHVIKMINMFIPMRYVSICLGLVLIVYNLKFGWSLLMWILRKIPGVS